MQRSFNEMIMETEYERIERGGGDKGSGYSILHGEQSNLCVPSAEEKA